MDAVQLKLSATDSSFCICGKIFAFVLPGYALVLLGTIMSAIDKAFMGHISSLQLASIGPAIGAYDCSTFSLAFLGQATLALLGETQDKKQRDAVRSNAVAFAALAGAIVGTLLAANAESIVRVFGASDRMVPFSVPYLRVRALGMFIGRTRDVSNQFCIADKDVITPLFSTIIATGVNVAGDMVLCKRFGTLGAALATDIASAAAAGFVIQRLRQRSAWPHQLRLPSRGEFAQFSAYAGAIFVNNLLKMVAIVTMGAFAGRLGTHQAAAHQICVSVWMMCGFALGMPLTWAARAFLPPGRRRDDETRRIVRMLLVVTAVACGLGAGTSTLLLRHGLNLFTTDVLVKKEVEGCATFVMLTVVFCIYYQSLEGVMITQEKLQEIVTLGGSLTLLFTCSCMLLYVSGSLSTSLLWVALSFGIFIVCLVSTKVAFGGFSVSRRTV